MTDTITKGSGNSRSIKSVPNLRQLAPTYDALLDLLTGDGVPIDLGPLNDAGLLTLGTALVKATLLSDATETALWGDAADRTPDEAIEKLRQLINTTQNTANEKLQAVSGTYTGTGLYGEDNPNTLVFPFEPKIVFITCWVRNSNTQTRPERVFILTLINGTDANASILVTSNSVSAGLLQTTWDGTMVSWYSRSNAGYQMNEEVNRLVGYYYIAIG